jgi:hypothetical protein
MCAVEMPTLCTLQVYPKLYLNGGSMYEAHWWIILVRVWEILVYNPVLDLEKWWQILTPVALVAYVTWKLWVRCIRPRWRRRQDKRLMLPTKQGNSDSRDLSV